MPDALPRSIEAMEMLPPPVADNSTGSKNEPTPIPALPLVLTPVNEMAVPVALPDAITVVRLVSESNRSADTGALVVPVIEI